MILEEFQYVNTDLPTGWKPYYIYLIVVKNKVVGKIVLREGYKEERYYDGHIGYSIDSNYRGHHYAYKACLKLKDIARDKGFKELIITCNPDNIASKKTILKLGALYLETKTIPNDIKHNFDINDIEKEIYLLKL